MPVEVEYASELRYRNPPLDNDTLVFAITQSGETADTLAALREMKRKGIRRWRICNVVGSTIAQRSRRRHLSARRAGDRRGLDQGLHLAMRDAGDAGPVFRPAAAPELRRRACGSSSSCRSCPTRCGRRWQPTTKCRRIAAKYRHCNNFLYLGRQYNFPTALEGALKLKEISYIHAEGYPAAEMKHGPIALVDEHTPSVFLIPHGQVYDKVMSNLRGDQGPRRAGDRRRLRGRHARRRTGRRRDRGSRASRTSCSRSSPSFRCSCWPTTSPCCAAATSTSRATWPRA